jgi:uncharacterized protein YndB with AHSA1/START domain
MPIVALFLFVSLQSAQSDRGYASVNGLELYYGVTGEETPLLLLHGGLRDGGWDGSGRPNAQLAILPGSTHYNIIMSPMLVPTTSPFINTPLPGEPRELTITSIFDVPVEQLWEAWSESSLIKQWWGPYGFTAPIAEIDFREGGISLVAMSSPSFGTFYNTWSYKKIVPMERIEFVHHFSDRHGNRLDPAETGLPIAEGIPYEVPHVITFKSLENGTAELTVVEYGYTTDRAVELSRMGMEQCLDKIAQIYSRPQER